MYLGSAFNAAAGRYNGWVDEIIVYNYAATQPLVTALFTSFSLGTANISDVETKVLIYPNPVKEMLLIKSDNKIQYVEIYSIVGQKVIESKEKQINNSKLGIRIYIVKIQDAESKVTTKKIIIK